MAKAEYGTPKYIAKQMKLRGLQKTKFYCQICSKQCRDANGFKAHAMSKSHTRKAQEVTKDTIEEYSNTMERDFLRLLRMAHGSKAVNANKFYQEYIQNDRDHVHLNATRFLLLSGFVRHLLRSGKVELVGEMEEGNMQNTFIKLKEEEGKGGESKKKEREKVEKSEEEVRMALLKRKMELEAEKNRNEEQKEPEILETDEKMEQKKVVPIKLALKKTLNKVQKVDLGFKRR